MILGEYPGALVVDTASDCQPLSRYATSPVFA